MPPRRPRGFTLLEAIIAMVILGVLGMVVAVFIRMPVQGYVDSVGRAEVSDEADLALRRIARDLRLALPNSIRVSPDRTAIEFLPTKTGGRYLSVEDTADPAFAGLLPLDFVNGNTRFTVVGAMPSLAQAAAGDYVVVYNLGEGLSPSDAWQYTLGQRNIARIKSVDLASSVIELLDNPFAVQSPPMPSPQQRFQVVGGPVTYACMAEPGSGILNLWRFSNYPITPQQPLPPPASAQLQKSLVATRLASCAIFDYSTPASQRSALVIMSLELKARNERDPTIRLVNQVHVDNTP